MDIIEVTDSGIVTTSRNNIFNSLMEKFKAVYGGNTYIDKGTEDYNMISLIADVFSDMGNVAVSAGNALSLTNAVGTQLDNIASVYYGSFSRKGATSSTVQLTITGVVNTTIVNGKVRDNLGGVWSLPTTVTIPTGNTINVTATYTETGAYYINNDSISGRSCIATPVSGWENVSQIDNTVIIGRDVESDADFRIRIAQRSKGTAKSTLETLGANILAVDEISQVRIYENDTSDVKDIRSDLINVPSHSIVPVVYASTSLNQNELAKTIYNYKSSGVGTYGTTTVSVSSVYAQNIPIKFTLASSKSLTVKITLKKLNENSFSLTEDAENAVKEAVVKAVENYQIGDTIYSQDFYYAIITTLANTVGASQYNINALKLVLEGSSTEVETVVVPYNAKAVTSNENITITVV